MPDTAIGNDDDATRARMVGYWDKFSTRTDEVSMMLDENAEKLGEEEIPELLEQLPELKGKDVLELGAGIGRFTGKLAEEAHSVLALDFIESFCEKNREIHSHLDNVTVRQADATELALEPNSLDLVFSNWLLMYLSDEEVLSLMTRILKWLRPGGHLFFRESCYHSSGNLKHGENPTRYRSPTDYYDKARFPSVVEDGKTYKLSVLSQKSVQTYVKLKNNRNQVCWLMEKMAASGDKNSQDFQQFLDENQYSRNSILRYEKIFGRHFISTGGLETTEEFVKMLDLKPGQKVLDVGCGIGGSAFYMAKKFDVKVLGIDLSCNMINIALERLNELKESRVQFEVCDATTRDFEEGSFDVIYSRDTILHISDKKALFERFLYWLKPGGRLLISDYCCSDGEHSDDFKKYVAQRGYILLSPVNYGKVLGESGFVNVLAEDRSQHFTSVLRSELQKTKSIKEEYIKEFSEKDYNDIVDGWQDKLERVALGDQRWGLFIAQKPL